MQTISQYSQKNILVLPEGLFSMEDAHLLYQQGSNAFFYKDLKHDLINVEFYCNQPCVVYIESGQECITNCRNQTLTLTTGFATILPNGLNLHSDFVKSTQNLKAYLVFLDSNLIKEFFISTGKDLIEASIDNELISIRGGKSLSGYFSGIKAICNENLCSSELMKHKQFELLHILNLRAPLALNAMLAMQTHIPPKRNLQRLLNEPYTYLLSVNDLANLSGRSSSSFQRDFKAIFKVTPKQWLNEKRLLHANTLLEQNFSVTQVALELGYENISHFIHAFKKRHGITPKQFQKNKEYG